MSSSVAAYLARLRPSHRAALKRLRQAIRAAAPKAEECISYGIPSYKVNGRMLVSFGDATNHCAFYPGAWPLQAHAAEVAGYALSTGTIRFPPERPLPATLVRRLVRTRLAQRAEEAAIKSSSGARGARSPKGRRRAT